MKVNEEIALKLFDYLREQLTKNKNYLVTYGDLGLVFGLQPRFQIPSYLDRIHRYCLDYNLPPICVIVVRADSKIPGNGYAWKSFNKEDKKRQFIEDCSKVYEYDWSNVNI